MTKEEYVELVRQLRQMIESGKFAHCTCPKTKCEWHGKCFECVMIHRYHQDHIPNCLQPILQNKVKELAKTVELNVFLKERTPDEYWDYVREVCPLEKKEE